MNCILFDMDGVLVDVSRSYRRAVLKTVEYFSGDMLTEEEVQSYKNRGGLNNDWDLTAHILIEKAILVEKDEIIEAFQKYYWGQDHDGLIRFETWLLERNIIEILAKAHSLGIVTGRPSRETAYILDRFGFSGCFQAVVTMDDLPRERGKPHPDGILMAWKKLGGERAFYLGDTVDDMEAAARAGAYTIGVTPPGSDRVHQTEILRRAGARAVLGNVNQILEVVK